MSAQKATSDFQEFRSKKSDAAAVAVAGAAGATTAVLVAQRPAEANVEGVSTMVGSLGTLAAAAFAVAIVPVGIYYAVKIVKRVMSA